MTKKLVIVESPSKSKTIEKYLGSNYKVVSSLGHIRDLATTGKYGFGIDLENGYKPDYEIIKGKKKLVSALKKDVKDAEFVYLATDPDREGEAISWHLFDTLGLKKDKYKRIVFNEITKDVILSSFDSARDIDDDLVKSQETRRMLDRIIGFRLSKLMQSKTGGKSAGRVQSVALKLIVDKEREIEAFIKEDYYEIDAKFTDFEAKLDSYKNKKIEIKTEEEAKEHPRKNVLMKALGANTNVEMDIFNVELGVDGIFLCSDGLTNMLEDEHISKVLSEELEIEKKIRNFRKRTN